MYFFLLSYTILGAGIKYIDSAYDEKTFSKKLAMVLAPFLGLLWTYTMFINPASATILLAILIGVILKGKIDNVAHFSGVIVIIPIIILLGIELMFVPLLLLATAAVLDEVGNDYFGKKTKELNKNIGTRLILYYFDQRWLLKSAILILSLIGIIPFYFFIAMILFDYSYLSVRYVSELKQGKKSDLSLIYTKIKSFLPQKIIFNQKSR